MIKVIESKKARFKDKIVDNDRKLKTSFNQIGEIVIENGRKMGLKYMNLTPLLSK